MLYQILEKIKILFNYTLLTLLKSMLYKSKQIFIKIISNKIKYQKMNG